MWYLISIATFIAILWFFTKVGYGGQNNLIADDFFRASGWFNGWRWVFVYVIATIIVAFLSTFTKVHIMPAPLQPYHMPAGFYWWAYTLGLFVFILIWRSKRKSYQAQGPFRTNFRKSFTTYAIVSMICVSLVVTTLKVAVISILGVRYVSEQVEETVDQTIEKAKDDSTFTLR